jgi:xanthine dehydrogenase accessory factor
MTLPVIIRGGGDLASGVAIRLHRAGIRLIIAELEKPLAVRRTVSFAQAIYSGQIEIEGVLGKKVENSEEAAELSAQGKIPVMVAPELDALSAIRPIVIVNARMLKSEPDTSITSALIVIGLGPGFVAGRNCYAVVETLRGHNLGRVFREGTAAIDTGIPGKVAGHNIDRVLRAPVAGRATPLAEIGDQLKAGDLIARIDGAEIRAAFDGVLRGLIHPSVDLTVGMKIGDLDPRNDPSFCHRVSDKARAIGGGVLEAILSREEIRTQLWQ